jgi:hypothetical protein
MTIPLPEMLDLDGDDCMRALAESSREFAELCAEVCRSLADNTVSDNELRRVESETGQLIATLNSLLATMVARNAASKPGPDRAAAAGSRG